MLSESQTHIYGQNDGKPEEQSDVKDKGSNWIPGDDGLDGDRDDEDAVAPPTIRHGSPQGQGA